MACAPAVPQEMTGLKLGEWAPDTAGGGLAARRATYSKPSPVGPVPVVEDQTVGSNLVHLWTCRCMRRSVFC